MKILRLLLIQVAVLSLTGCGNPVIQEQREAYLKAVKMEQKIGGDRSIWVKDEYRKVVLMDPGSKWAEKAQNRMDAIQQNINAYKALREERFNRLLDGYR